MNIRKKTLLQVGIILSAFIVLLTSASYVLVSKRFESLERSIVQDQMVVFQNELNHILEDLGSICADWAPWDDTYAFVEDLNPNYIQNNLVDSTFENLRLNFMLFYHNDRKLIFSRFFEQNPKHSFRYREAVLNEIAQHPRLIGHKTPQSRVTCIVIADTMPFLIASHPVVTSNFEGPIRGAMVIGRALYPDEVAKISAEIKIPLKIYTTRTLPATLQVDALQPVLKSAGQSLIVPRDAKTILGYTSIADVNGKPALLSEITLDRQITRYGYLTWLHNAVAMVLLGLALLFLLFYLLDHTILKPLGDLTRQVGLLTLSRQDSGRIMVNKKDEIGRLAQGINTMLDEIQQYHHLQVDHENQYRAIVEDQNELICRLDHNSNVVFVNGAFSQFFNRPRATLVGHSIETIIPAMSQWVPQKTNRKNQVDTHRMKISNSAGEPRWLQWQRRTLLNVSEDEPEYQLVGLDLTDQIAAEAALQESERFLRQLIDSINCGVMVVDQDSRTVVDVNISGTKLFKRQRDDIIGKICHRLVCPKEMGDCPVMDHGQAIDLSERRLLKPDGTTLPILKSVTSIERGERRYLVESFIDISRLRQTEIELRLSEERYRRFFEQDITGDSLTLAEGNIIDCNPAFARMFGYESVEEIMGVNIANFYRTKNQRQVIMDRLKREKKIERVELEFVHRSNRPLYVIGNLIGHFDEKGILKQISAYLFDDTKRVLLENDLRQTHKMEAIGTLAGGIAHDFNNILSGIMGYTEIALMELPSPGKTSDLLGKALNAANRAKELVQQILTFSRQTESENKPVKIATIVNEVYNLIRASLPTTIEVRENIISDATIMADPVQIHQVIMNLCTNAGHAMKDSGGKLTISVNETNLANPRAEGFNDISPGKYACIQIEDTGGGIPDEIIDRIFDPFFTTKNKAEGTGLGLSVVHGIVTKSGGAIKVASSPQGTRFDVFLPYLDDDVEPSSQSLRKIPKGNETIVIVDDEDFIVDIEKQMLTSLGYDVIGFTSSAEALRYIRENKDGVNLVITDMTMPELTGTALTEQLSGISSQLPVILSTGVNDQFSPGKLASMGISGFIKKPMVISDLASTVRNVLDAA